MSEQAENTRLLAQRNGEASWRLWGPYLSERSWGTVREDYSHDGNAWGFFPHDHASSKAYRWGEDGIAGISDDRQYLCFAIALWNGSDSILKERLFGLANGVGNHGEDVKEVYFYLDSTPTHSYMKLLYKYPQRAFPYADLLAENRQRGLEDFEYELLDTGSFDDGSYFDVLVEYAKAGVDDILIRLSAANRADQPAPVTLLPTIWFRNTWSWGYQNGPMRDVPDRPLLRMIDSHAIQASHPVLGTYHLYIQDQARLLFTENETNTGHLYGVPNASPYTKDAFHRYVIGGQAEAANPDQVGTKAAALIAPEIAPGETFVTYLRLSASEHARPFDDAADIFAARITEADDFYATIHADGLTEDEQRVLR